MKGSENSILLLEAPMGRASLELGSSGSFMDMASTPPSASPAGPTIDVRKNFVTTPFFRVFKVNDTGKLDVTLKLPDNIGNTKYVFGS